MCMAGVMPLFGPEWYFIPIRPLLDFKSPFIFTYNFTIVFQVKTTRMLLVVSTVFLMLNVPNHVFRVYSFITDIKSAGSHHRLSNTSKHVQEFCQLLYYLNFAINFFLYSFCAKRFWDAFSSLLSKSKLWCVNLLQRFIRLLCCIFRWKNSWICNQ